MERNAKKMSKKNALHTIQIAVTDKENLTRNVVQKKRPAMTSTKDTNIKKKSEKTPPIEKKNTVEVKNKINKVNVEITQNDNAKITAEDLTNDNASENYWQKIAESRRIALDSALKENVDLHNKVTELEYENGRLKEMLEESRSLIEVLTEMLEEKESNSEVTDLAETSVLDESKDDEDDASDNNW